MLYPKTDIRHWICLVALALCFVSFPSFAEDKEGAAAQTTREASLRQGPSETSPSLGRLPRGTILTLQGAEKSGFVSVSVELEEGSIEGWIPRSVLSGYAGADDDADEPTAKRKKTVKTVPIDTDQEVDSGGDESPAPVKSKARAKIQIPRDEGVLLKRDPLFFYGLQAGAGLDFLRGGVSGTFYVGPLFSGGVHFGIYLQNDIPLSLEIGYSNWNAGAASARSSLEFAFIDILPTISYVTDNFELTLGVQYSYGISATNVPVAEGSVNSPSDLSSLYLIAGVGYRIPIGDISDFVIRARYGISGQTIPLNFEGLTLMGCLSFRG